MSESTEIEFLVHPRQVNKGKLILVVSPLDENGQPTRECSYFTAPKTFYFAGWICKATGEVDPDTGRINTLATNAISSVRQYEPEYWQMKVQDEANARGVKLQNDAKKATTATLLDECLAPIQKAMAGTNAQGRAALIGLVIQRLTKGH